MDQPKAADVDKLLTLAGQDTDVLAVLLFGSVARGEPSPRSDIDVCLIVMPQRTPYESASQSRKRLEYLARVDLDVQIFRALPVYIRSRVLKEGRVLFVRDEDLLYEIAFRIAQAFEDFKHSYYGYLEQVAHARP